MDVATTYYRYKQATKCFLLWISPNGTSNLTVHDIPKLTSTALRRNGKVSPKVLESLETAIDLRIKFSRLFRHRPELATSVVRHNFFLQQLEASFAIILDSQKQLDTSNRFQPLSVIYSDDTSDVSSPTISTQVINDGDMNPQGENPTEINPGDNNSSPFGLEMGGQFESLVLDFDTIRTQVRDLWNRYAGGQDMDLLTVSIITEVAFNLLHRVEQSCFPLKDAIPIGLLLGNMCSLEALGEALTIKASTPPEETAAFIKECGRRLRESKWTPSDELMDKTYHSISYALEKIAQSTNPTEADSIRMEHELLSEMRSTLFPCSRAPKLVGPLLQIYLAAKLRPPLVQGDSLSRWMKNHPLTPGDIPTHVAACCRIVLDIQKIAGIANKVARDFDALAELFVETTPALALKLRELWRDDAILRLNPISAGLTLARHFTKVLAGSEINEDTMLIPMAHLDNYIKLTENVSIEYPDFRKAVQVLGHQQVFLGPTPPSDIHKCQAAYTLALGFYVNRGRGRSRNKRMPTPAPFVFGLFEKGELFGELRSEFWRKVMQPDISKSLLATVQAIRKDLPQAVFPYTTVTSKIDQFFGNILDSPHKHIGVTARKYYEILTDPEVEKTLRGMKKAVEAHEMATDVLHWERDVS